jgi:hypothetical protein
MENPAQTVIAKLGGVKVAMEVCGVVESTVHRWTYPREKGTGGVIPYQYIPPILKYAKAKKIRIAPSDFMPVA